MAIRSISSKPGESSIHWPIVVSAAAGACVFVFVLLMTAWVAGRPIETQKESTHQEGEAPGELFELLARQEPSPSLTPIPIKEEDTHLAQRQPPISSQEIKPAPKVETKNQIDDTVVRSASVPVAKVQTEIASESCGTHVEFARNPTEAARLAKQDNKLMFVLHVSGNFEEAKFT